LYLFPHIGSGPTTLLQLNWPTDDRFTSLFDGNNDQQPRLERIFQIYSISINQLIANNDIGDSGMLLVI